MPMVQGLGSKLRCVCYPANLRIAKTVILGKLNILLWHFFALNSENDLLPKAAWASQSIFPTNTD